MNYSILKAIGNVEDLINNCFTCIKNIEKRIYFEKEFIRKSGREKIKVEMCNTYGIENISLKNTTDIECLWHS